MEVFLVLTGAEPGDSGPPLGAHWRFELLGANRLAGSCLRRGGEGSLAPGQGYCSSSRAVTADSGLGEFRHPEWRNVAKPVVGREFRFPCKAAFAPGGLEDNGWGTCRSSSVAIVYRALREALKVPRGGKH
jgi:hypothetical protein